MNGLLGLQRFGIRREWKVFLTQSQAPKNHSSIFKKNRFRPRSFQTSVPLFAKGKNKPLVTKEMLGATRVSTRAEAAAKRASATNSPSDQAVTVGPYRFPVIAGENGPLWYDDQLVKWGGEPPFLDRDNALFTLLRNAYITTSSGGKPVVTVATTSGGFGKTRILVEWIAQIFKHPFIVASFLANKDQLDCTNIQENTSITDLHVDDLVTTNIQDQIDAALKSDNDPKLKDRAAFLLRLFNAGISGSIITIHALRNRRILELISGVDILSEAQVNQVCKAILISGITSHGSPFSEEDMP